MIQALVPIHTQTLVPPFGQEIVQVITTPGTLAPPSPSAAPKTGFLQERLPFVIATGGEFIALFFWLQYWDEGSAVLAVIVLWAGFLTERVAVLGWVNNFESQMEAKYPDFRRQTGANDFKDKPKAQQFAHLLLITLSEIVIWVTALFVFDRNGWVPALAVLVIGEQLQHSWELGLIAHRPIGDYIPTWNALKITLLETVGGVIWIGLVRHGQPQVGGLFLLIGLSIEHVVQGAKIKTDLEASFRENSTGGPAPATTPAIAAEGA
jgi:hypothetical protein